MTHAISWFEIPANDLKRAAAFYTHILGRKVAIETFGDLQMAPLSDYNEPGSVSGAIMKYEGYIPSETHGPLLYLNGGENLQNMLDRVAPAGGKVIMPKTQISPEQGYMAMFIDSEGNRMALHSPG